MRGVDPLYPLSPATPPLILIPPKGRPVTNESEGSGGLRDPLNFWDFMDQWIGGGRDRGVVIGDILSVVDRFGASRTEGEYIYPADGALAVEEALEPPLSQLGYHPIADRDGTIPGQNTWNLLPPDGSIVIGDIMAVVAQFGHSCA